MAEQTVEEVLASELVVGDEVWIPNSRKPQAIDSITTEEDRVVLIVGDATWQTRASFTVRRVAKAED